MSSRRRTYTQDGRSFDPKYFITIGSMNGKIYLCDINSYTTVASFNKTFYSDTYYSDDYQARLDDELGIIILSGRTTNMGGAYLYYYGPGNESNWPLDYDGADITVGTNLSYALLNSQYENTIPTQQIIKLSDMSIHDAYGIIFDGYGNLYAFILRYHVNKGNTRYLVKMDSDCIVTDVLSDNVNDGVWGFTSAGYNYYDVGTVLSTWKYPNSSTSYGYKTGRYIFDIENVSYSKIGPDCNERSYSSNTMEPTLVV